MLDIFSGTGHDLLKKMLDVTTERHRIISHNISNVNTPGFKRSDLEFVDELKTVLNADESALADLQPSIVQTNNTPVRHDGNDVNLNKELAIVAKNTIMYNLYIQFMRKRFNSLNLAMQGPQ